MLTVQEHRGSVSGPAPRATPAPPEFQVGTIIARNYLPFARVLAEALAGQALGLRLTALVIDGPLDPTPGQTLDEIGPLDLELTRAQFLEMAACYDLMELATALKPWFLRWMLARGPGPALYLDPDIDVLAPLDEFAGLASTHGMVLTPHAVAPVPRDGRRPAERELMASGVFNLGMIGVSRQATDFLGWWQERLRRDAIVDPEHMLFTDQRWVDLATGHFPFHVERDPGYNVAYWNAESRGLRREGGRWLAGGSPLRTLHFSGFQPDLPHLLSRHQGEHPRVLLSEQPALRELCRDYADRLRAQGYSAPLTPEYGFARIPGGPLLDTRMRRVYREALIRHEREAGREPPNPFRPGEGTRFVEWLAEPEAAHRPQVSRYLLSLYRQRTDLQAVFPRVPGPDSGSFLDWVGRYGEAEAGVRDPFLPGAAGEVPGPPSPQRGLNLLAMATTKGGVARAAGQLGAAARAAGIQLAEFAYRPGELILGPGVLDDDGPPFDLNLVSVNPSHLPDLELRAGQLFFQHRYTIGQWAWETERLPAPMAAAGHLVDEVWVASEFERAAVAPAVGVPVHLFPMPVPPGSAGASRSLLGLPEGFLFLFCFDYLSELERKNPLGLVEAFSRAFPPGSGPRLVLKSLRGEERLLERERVRLAVLERPDITLIEEAWGEEEMDRLMASCDCYVSLHRSEGFGLTLAEAMVRGRPVIGTGYSGNLQFMDDSNSLLVRYQLTDIGPHAGPYPPDQVWAEPDLEHAAWLMRQVASGEAGVQERAERGRQLILERHSLEAASRFIAGRLEEIREGPGARRGFPSHDSRHPGGAHTPRGRAARRLVRSALGLVRPG